MKSISIKWMAIGVLLSLQLTHAQQGPGPFDALLGTYMSLSEALVKSDAVESSRQAEALVAQLRSFEPSALQPDARKAYETALPGLQKTAAQIAAKKNLVSQREAFRELSTGMYILAGAAGHGKPLYYNNCPMAKGNWLSTDKAIRNPYYGSQMLSCGKTVETIK